MILSELKKILSGFGMNRKKINTVGIVGFGNISIRHCKNLKILFPHVKVLGVSSSGKNTKKPENIDTVLTTIEELINLKPDFVIVASPSSFHHEHCLRLVESKVPVLVEKPIFSSLKNIKSFPTIKSSLFVAYCLRFLPSAKVVQELIAEKRLGTLLNIDINVGQYLPDWRPTRDYKHSVSARKELGGGVLLELSHEIDMISWIFKDVKLLWSCLRNTGELEINVEEVADLIFDVDGAICNMHLDFLQKKPKRLYVFSGTKGSLEWNIITKEVIFYSGEKKEIIYCERDYDANKMYLDMLNEFSSSLDGNLNNRLCSFEEAIKTVSLVEEAKQKNINLNLE